MKSNTNKTKWVILLILSIIIIISSVVFLSLNYFSKGTSKEDLLPDTTTSQDISDNTESITDESVILIDNPIDFASLKETNTDIYAWINIPGTMIDYPVLQAGKGKDDFFYLDHNAKGNYEFAGSIYSEKQNALDFSDPVTVLYGHNMLNGSMFAELHNFEDEKFFKKHKNLYIYTPGHKLTYKIFAAYEYDNRHILNSFNFDDVAVVKDYFNYTLNPTTMVRNIRQNVTLNETDKIITLSTCTNSSATRYLVQGVLIKDELTR